jgi:hypothetical protein
MSTQCTGRPWAAGGRQALAWGAICLAFQGQAQAVGLNQMSATALENTVSIDAQAAGVSVNVPVTAAVINGGSYAAASATALRLTARASSADVQTNHMDAIAVQWSSFTYWNTATNSAYAAADLAGQSLTLDVALTGEVNMPGALKDGNARSTSYTYSATLYTLSPVGQAGGATLGCGPSGCVGTGAPLQLGSNTIDTRFALSSPITAGMGMLDTYLSVFDGGGASSLLALSVTGAHVSGGAALPLALRFEDGSLYAVTTVPEAGSLVLAMAGVAALMGHQRRRQVRRAPQRRA